MEPSPKQKAEARKVTLEKLAALAEVEAAQKNLEAACWRGHEEPINRRTAEAMDAYQCFLDAVAADISMAKRLLDRQ